MKKIILDTNFLMVPAQFGVDIFSEIERLCHFNYKLCILDKSIEELEKIIQEQKGKHKSAAKLAFTIINAKKPQIIKTEDDERKVDDLLVEFAEKEGAIIATQDKLLKTRIGKRSKVITLRKKQYLIIS